MRWNGTEYPEETVYVKRGGGPPRLHPHGRDIAALRRSSDKLP